MGLFGGDSGKSAMRAQLAALRKARKERTRVAGEMETRADEFTQEGESFWGPYTQLFDDAVATLAGPDAYDRMVEGFLDSPDFRITLDEEMKALERQMAAGGERFSGRMLTEAAELARLRTNKGLGDYMNRRMQFTGQQLGAGGTAMTEMQRTRETGFGASLEALKASDLSQIYLEEGAVKANYELAKGERRRGLAGSLGSIAGAGLGFVTGGPLGAFIGAQVGGQAAPAIGEMF